MKCETCDSEFDESQVKIWVGKTVCQSCFAILNRGHQADRPSTVEADPPQPTASHEQPHGTPDEERHLPFRRLPSQAGVPDWRYTAGTIALVIGGLGFVASAVVGGQGDFEAGILSGLLNPLFFISFPLGIYWLHQARIAAEAARSPHKPKVADSETEDDWQLRLRHEAHRRRTKSQNTFIFVILIAGAIILLLLFSSSQIGSPFIRPEF